MNNSKKLMRIALLIITFIIGSLTFTSTVAAQACQPLYGGGVTKEQFCPTPTPLNVAKTQPKQTTTKGGLPVNKPTTTVTTPATGPSLLGFLALAPLGLLGLILRQRTSA